MDGTPMEINMLVEKKYPLIKELLEKTLNLQLEAEKKVLWHLSLSSLSNHCLKSNEDCWDSKAFTLSTVGSELTLLLKIEENRLSY
ncbi:hypothetical protein Tco_1365838 [Tanacetum coccineum]